MTSTRGQCSAVQFSARGGFHSLFSQYLKEWLEKRNFPMNPNVRLFLQLAGSSVGRLVCLAGFHKRAGSHTLMLLSEHFLALRNLCFFPNLYNSMYQSQSLFLYEKKSKEMWQEFSYENKKHSYMAIRYIYSYLIKCKEFQPNNTVESTKNST